MGETAGRERAARATAFTHLLAEAAIGTPGAGEQLVLHLHRELGTLLRRAATEHKGLTLAQAGALVPRYWAKLEREQAAAGSRRREGKAKAGKPMAADGSGNARQRRVAAAAQAGASNAATTTPTSGLFLYYVEQAAAVMRELVDELLARAEPAGAQATALLRGTRQGMQALDALQELEPSLARLARLRWLGGLDVATAASLLDDSEPQTQRHWRRARAFLVVAAGETGSTGGKRARGAGASRQGARGTRGEPAVPRPLPDAPIWSRVTALFETGSELAPELHEGWLQSLRDQEAPLTLEWLHDMLGASGSPQAEGALERSLRLPLPTNGLVTPEPAPAQVPADAAAASAAEVAQASGQQPAAVAAQPAAAMAAMDDGSEPAAQPEPRADARAGARAGAPPLATGMRLGPWLLLGPMPGTDPRVSQWRARRADSDAAENPELSLLVPHQWRPQTDLAGRLEHAAARCLTLAHPNIARVLAVGVADDGTPWIASELAEGQSIERWCREHDLGLRERRALIDVALEAAAFAHARLVSHGRIHPSQLVVAPNGHLEWLNFGLEEVLALLEVPSRPDSPGAGAPPAQAYAAPEVLAGPARGGAAVAATAPAGTTVDVHALGLVLFEVLSGASPWQPQAHGGAKPLAPGTNWRRPSDLASTWARRRALRGDLDAIVAKATQTDPERRYTGAAALRDDLLRAAEHRPVAAVGTGLAYDARCFVRRHRAASACALLCALALVAAAATLSWRVWSSTQRHEEAEAAWRDHEATSRLLQTLLQEAAGASGGWPQTLARAEAVARISLAERPAELAAALAVLARHQLERGALREGRRLLAQTLPRLAHAAARQEASCDDAWAQARLAENPPAAEARLRRIADEASARPATRALCLTRLADLERRTGRTRDARATALAARRSWSTSATRPASTALLLALPMGELAVALHNPGEARSWFEWGLQQLEKLQQGHTPAALALRERLGQLALAAGDAARAMSLADTNLVALTGAEFPAVQGTHAPPAGLFVDAAEPRLELHRLDEARARLERAAALAEARGDAATLRRARCLLATAALRDRDAAAAERWLRLPSSSPSSPPSGDGSGASATANGAARSANAASASAGGSTSGAAAEAEEVLAAAAEGAQSAMAAATRAADQRCRVANAELSLAQGHHTEAQRETEQLLGLGSSLTPGLAAAAALVRADAMMAAQQNERALAAALQAVQHARSLQLPGAGAGEAQPSFRSGEAAVVLAEAQRAAGDLDAAKTTMIYAQQQLAATLPESHPWRRRAEETKAALASPTGAK